MSLGHVRPLPTSRAAVGARARARVRNLFGASGTISSLRNLITFSCSPPLARNTILMLLAIAGIERNPGPRPVRQPSQANGNQNHRGGGRGHQQQQHQQQQAASAAAYAPRGENPRQSDHQGLDIGRMRSVYLDNQNRWTLYNGEGPSVQSFAPVPGISVLEMDMIPLHRGTDPRHGIGALLPNIPARSAWNADDFQRRHFITTHHFISIANMPQSYTTTGAAARAADELEDTTPGPDGNLRATVIPLPRLLTQLAQRFSAQRRILEHHENALLTLSQRYIDIERLALDTMQHFAESVFKTIPPGPCPVGRRTILGYTTADSPCAALVHPAHLAHHIGREHPDYARHSGLVPLPPQLTHVSAVVHLLLHFQPNTRRHDIDLSSDLHELYTLRSPMAALCFVGRILQRAADSIQQAGGAAAAANNGSLHLIGTQLASIAQETTPSRMALRFLDFMYRGSSSQAYSGAAFAWGASCNTISFAQNPREMTQAGHCCDPDSTHPFHVTYLDRAPIGIPALLSTVSQQSVCFAGAIPLVRTNPSEDIAGTMHRTVHELVHNTWTPNMPSCTASLHNGVHYVTAIRGDCPPPYIAFQLVYDPAAPFVPIWPTKRSAQLRVTTADFDRQATRPLVDLRSGLINVDLVPVGIIAPLPPKHNRGLPVNGFYHLVDGGAEPGSAGRWMVRTNDADHGVSATTLRSIAPRITFMVVAVRRVVEVRELQAAVEAASLPHPAWSADRRNPFGRSPGGGGNRGNNDANNSSSSNIGGRAPMVACD